LPHNITVISQAFHNQRAVYLARRNHIFAIGVNAADVPTEQRSWRGSIREFIARGRAIVDTALFHRQPYFGGAKIIPGVTPQEGCVGTDEPTTKRAAESAQTQY